MHRAPRVALLAILAFAVGCKTRQDKPQPVDASVTEAASDASLARDGRWAGVVAARLLGPGFSLTPIEADALVLRDDLYVYGIDRDGSIKRVGAPADYIPLLREGQDELAGWEAWFEGQRETISGTIERPFVQPQGPGPKRTFGWNGSAWTAATNAPPPVEDYRFSSRYDDAHTPRPSTDGLPAGATWTHPHTTKSGIVWIGQQADVGTTKGGKGPRRIAVTAMKPTGQPARPIALPDDLDGKELASRSCEFLESADDGSYVRCSSFSIDDKHALSFYKLDGDRWVTFDLAKGHDRELMVIDAEGALWWIMGGNGSPPHVKRTATTNETEEIEIPVAPPELARAWYGAFLDDPPTPVERIWRSAVLVPKAAPVRIGFLHSMSARRSGDVWILGRDSGDIKRGATLVRFTRGASARPPIVIPSDGDERAAIFIARGIRPWTGRCNTAFVPFPIAESDGGTNAFYSAHEKEIAAAIAKIDGAKKTKAPIQVAVIEGHFDKQKVVGALFLRTEVEARLDVMEAAVSRLKDIATTSPASPPSVTCTVPSVDDIIAMLHGPAEK